MWRIEFTSQANKQFAKLNRQVQKDIVRYLDRIIEANDPYCFGKALMGDLSGFWRYRVGKYRIICEIQKEVLIIEIISLAKRDKVYN